MNKTNSQFSKTVDSNLVDSDTPWIGKIPSHWRMIPNKYLFVETTSKVGSKWNSYQLLSLTTEGVKEKDIEQTGGKIPESYDKYLIINKGQMIFCLFDLDVSAVFSGLSTYDGMITSAYNAYYANESIISKRYAKYFFDFVFSNRSYRYYSKNLRYSVTSDQFKGIKTLVPPLSEQIEIADYLDKKCGLVDDVIFNLTNKIETLDKYKRSLIKEKVTTGLNNNDFVDSGTPWIGKIPGHWKKAKVKNIFTIKNSKARQMDPVVLTLARSGVRVRDISTNEGQLAESYFNYNPVSPGDLLLNPMDLISGANCSISNVEGVISPAYTNLKAIEGLSDPRYYDYYFKVQYWSMTLFSYGKGVSYDNRWTLNNQTLMNYRVIVPPLSEQIEIADYLDKKCRLIDDIKSDIEKEIETLKEYKQSLIFECVTGKKAVSDE